MMKKLTWRVSLLPTVAIFLGACASGPKITSLPVDATATDAPYRNVLVVSLFKETDYRQRLEQEVVKELSAKGVKAMAMTSLQRTAKPVNREQVVRMVELTGADSVLVTQLISLDSSVKIKDAPPAASYTFHQTNYYNVYTVELQQYEGPQHVRMKYNVALQTDLYSASSEQRVWAIASERKIKRDLEDRRDYSGIADEARAIVSALARGKLIGQ